MTVAVVCGLVWGTEWWERSPWLVSAAPFLVGLIGGWLVTIQYPSNEHARRVVVRAVLGPLVFVPMLALVAAQVAEGTDTETMLYAVFFLPSWPSRRSCSSFLESSVDG